MRQMTLVGFLHAQNCTNFVRFWRHPKAEHDFTSAEYYRRIGRALEAEKFDPGFFDDRLAMPDLFGGDHAHTVAKRRRLLKDGPDHHPDRHGHGNGAPRPLRHLSTTHFKPFRVARVFATLDLATYGRAAWNIVTSMNDGEA